MALQRPRLLPSKFARPFSVATRLLAERSCRITERRQRRRSEKWTRLKKRALQFWHVALWESRLWGIVGASTIVITTVSTLLFAPFFNVRSMRIERQNASIDIEEVQNALLPLFQRKLVLVTRSEVQAVLLPLYPESRRIDIRKEYPSTLIVRLELEQPVARILIEGDDMPMNNTGSLTPPLRTYVTQSGYFIESPLELRDGPFPTLTLVDWSVRPKNHTQLFPPEFLEMIASAQVILRRDFALEPKKVIVYVRAKEFHIRTDKATFWFDAKSSLSVSFDRFRQFLRSVPLTRVKEYVDLRVQGAVIYK